MAQYSSPDVPKVETKYCNKYLPQADMENVTSMQNAAWVIFWNQIKFCCINGEHFIRISLGKSFTNVTLAEYFYPDRVKQNKLSNLSQAG